MRKDIGKFRGMVIECCVSAGLMVFGHLWVNEDGRAYILTWRGDMEGGRLISESFEVDPDTVGEFTGLTDKNGVDVYERDIVISKDQDMESPEWLDATTDMRDIPLKEYMRDVVVMDRFPCFWLKNESFGYEGEDLINVEDCEVIGNIHENPELLEVTEWAS